MINKPNEVLVLVEEMALKKYNSPRVKLAILGVLGGAYIALGGWLSTFVAYGMPALTEGNPAMVKMFQGALFPVGLILIILVGGELFTGNTAYLVAGARKGVVPWRFIPINWVIVWSTNFLGALVFSLLLVKLAGMAVSEPWVGALVGTATTKVSLPWWVVFVRGIGANWLVCLAVWLGLSSKDMLGRLVGLWLPVMVFVTLGYEHSIANMFYIPMGMMCGADISVWEMIWQNLIPATLGNIVGGAVFVGLLYSYLYMERR